MDNSCHIMGCLMLAAIILHSRKGVQAYPPTLRFLGQRKRPSCDIGRSKDTHSCGAYTVSSPPRVIHHQQERVMSQHAPLRLLWCTRAAPPIYSMTSMGGLVCRHAPKTFWILNLLCYYMGLRAPPCTP